jgi:TonB family protein
MKGVLESPTPREGGLSSVFGTVTAVTYFAIGAAGVIALVMLAFSFIPFSSRAGRKSSPIVCLMLVDIIIVVLAGIYFWEARTSIVERDKDRVEEYGQPRESPSMNPNAVPLPNQVDDMLDDVNGSSPSSSGGKTISGGVLTDKATELPQPAYPAAARAVRASGSVSVQVVVDEKGEVASATAVSGHPLLRAAAVQAARKAKFKPTKLSGQSVKVTGVILYNFVP